MMEANACPLTDSGLWLIFHSLATWPLCFGVFCRFLQRSSRERGRFFAMPSCPEPHTWSETGSTTSRHTGIVFYWTLNLVFVFISQPENFTTRKAPSWILTLLDICVRCRQCCVGTELVDWLVLQSACVLTRSHAVGMWQALLEEGVLNHGEFLCRFSRTLWTVWSQLMHITKMVSWSFYMH